MGIAELYAIVSDSEINSIHNDAFMIIEND